ncbi:hypothetical protein Pf1_00035 [Flavobacterium columnare]|nr:hypothetical protein Pf1_00035 [Flavobacterium columnare]
MLKADQVTPKNPIELIPPFKNNKKQKHQWFFIFYNKIFVFIKQTRYI